MSNFSLSNRLPSGSVTKHCKPYVPSSVVVIKLFSLQTPLSSRIKSNSSLVLAPSTKDNRSVLAASCFAKKSKGAIPVPPPTKRTLPLLSVKLLPKGPRMPTASPASIVCKCLVASPTCFTETETSPLPASIMLMGISSTPGIQSIKNCPGLALEHNLSGMMKVLTVGLSSRTFTISVVLSVLAAMSEADNFFHTPIMFPSQINFHSPSYGLENLHVLQRNGTANLNCGSTSQ